MKFIIMALLLAYAATGRGQNSPIFGGGIGDGWDHAYVQHDDDNIFTGGSGDGWNLAYVQHDDDNIFTGGSSDGWHNFQVPLFVLAVENNDFGSGLVAYPNPTNGELNVKLGGVYKTVEVKAFNMLGQMVSSVRYDNADAFTVKIEGQAGNYILQLTTEIKMATIKVVKN